MNLYPPPIDEKASSLDRLSVFVRLPSKNSRLGADAKARFIPALPGRRFGEGAEIGAVLLFGRTGDGSVCRPLLLGAEGRALR